MIDTEARLARIERILHTLMRESAWDHATREADIEHPLSPLVQKAFAAGETYPSEEALDVRRTALSATRKERFPGIYKELFDEELA